MRMTLGEIARTVGGQLIGEDRPITGVRPLAEAGPEDLSFLANPKYRSRLEDCRAGGILVTPDVSSSRVSLVRVDRPYVALARVMPLFYPARRPPAGIDPRSALAADCQVGREASIGPFVVAGPGCRIGDRTILMAGVSLGPGVILGADCLLHPSVCILEGCEVGSRVIIHSGAVVGSDGFGFAEENGAHLKIPQIGNVVIEDDVEIGANVTLDRATFGSTRIRAGTKIDNLVQVGHNCDVGENSLLVAQVGLSGSVRVGRGVIFAGQSGSVGHVHIGDGSRVGAKSAVTTSLPEGSFVIGHPARDHREWKKAQAGLNRLPELRARVRFLERRLEELAARIAKKES